MRKLGKKSALCGVQKEYFLLPDPTVRRDLPLSVTDVHPALISILQHSFRLVRFRGMGVKFQLRVKVLLKKYSFENNKQMLVDVWFPSNSCSVHTPNEIRPRLGRAIGEMMSKFEAFVQQGSGWVVREVKVFSLTVNTFVLFSGGTVLFSFATDIGAHPGMHLDRGSVRREVLSQVHSGRDR